MLRMLAGTAPVAVHGFGGDPELRRHGLRGAHLLEQVVDAVLEGAGSIGCVPGEPGLWPDTQLPVSSSRTGPVGRRSAVISSRPETAVLPRGVLTRWAHRPGPGHRRRATAARRGPAVRPQLNHSVRSRTRQQRQATLHRRRRQPQVRSDRRSLRLAPFRPCTESLHFHVHRQRDIVVGCRRHQPHRRLHPLPTNRRTTGRLLYGRRTTFAAELRIPISSDQVRRLAGTRGSLRRAGLGGVCPDGRFTRDR